MSRSPGVGILAARVSMDIDTIVLKQRFPVINLLGVDDVPMVVPNVRDADGSLIHPSEYSKRLDNTTPVAVSCCDFGLLGQRTNVSFTHLL